MQQRGHHPYIRRTTWEALARGLRLACQRRMQTALLLLLASLCAIVATPAAAALALSSPALTVTVGGTQSVAVSGASGAVSVESSDTSVLRASYASGRVSVTGVKAGSATVKVKDSLTEIRLAVTVTTSTATTTSAYSLVAWNDLGMHCVDGKDYSIFSILPPYNNLHAQLVNASTGKRVTSGVTVTYEALADAQGSINTISSTKTNFWQYVTAMFGVSPAPDVGLAGNPTPSKTAAPMRYNATLGWFEAEGIPITPYDDARNKNFYPMVKVVARDLTGRQLAASSTVLPVSDEMTCIACHASRTTGNAAQLAAKPPKSGWAFEGDAERDWKKNILRLHDDKELGTAAFASALTKLGYDARGLRATAESGRPVLCAACHASNALPGTGIAGIKPMTAALHSHHSDVVDPTQQLKLDAIGNRSSCYLCHPGSVTKCLRGAMGNAVDASGNALMGCQSCHGNMKAVGAATRTGWLEEPNCQACHHDSKREISALDATGKLRAVTDARFATTANAPAAGFSLFRFSKGHGGLACEACHGATHAEYPSSHANDNVESLALQGHVGTISECTVCHRTVPQTVNGGPHGMHANNSAWVSSHGDQVERTGPSACAYCHGADYRGSALSIVRANRTFNIEGGTRTFAPGHRVGCYDCHNGPRGD